MTMIRRLPLLTIPLALAALLILIMQPVPAQAAPAPEQPPSAQAAATLPRPAVQATGTLTPTYYLGAPVQTRSPGAAWAEQICADGITAKFNFWRWEVPYTNERSDPVVGFVLIADRRFEHNDVACGYWNGYITAEHNIIVGTGTDASPAPALFPGASLGSYPCWMRGGNTPYIYILSMDHLGAPVGDWFPGAAGTGSANTVFALDDRVLAPGETAYLNVQRGYKTPPYCDLPADPDGYQFPFGLIPIYYGAQTCEACETCVTAADLIAAGTAGSAITVTVEASATYMVEGAPALQVSGDGGATWSALAAAGETCGTCITDTALRVYVTPISGTLALMGGDYAVYDASCGGSAGSCAGWVQGSHLATGIIPSWNGDAGVFVPPINDPPTESDPQLQPGETYAIEFANPWYDGDTPSYLADTLDTMAQAFLTLPDWPGEHCTEQLEPGRYRVYFRALADRYTLRVSNQDGNWDNNQGALGYNLYAADYNPPSSPACGAKYRESGSYLTGYVTARQESVHLPYGLGSLSSNSDLVVNAPYLIRVVTEGGGLLDKMFTQWRWWSSYANFVAQVVPSVKLEISTDRVNWYPITDAPGIDGWECGWTYDPNTVDGLDAFYLRAQEGVEYWLRVPDPFDTWDNNVGGVWVEIVNLDDYDFGDDNNCAARFGDLQYIGSAAIPPTDPIPANIPPDISQWETGQPLVPNYFYAIESAGGPWQDGAPGDTADHYDLSISPDGEQTWYPLHEYPGASCIEHIDDNHVRVYFQHTADLADLYKIRVNDINGDWSDNTGYGMGYNLYATTSDPLPEPRPEMCEGYYNYSTLIDSGVITGTDAVGVALQHVVNGEMYYLRVQSLPGGWRDPDGELGAEMPDISSDAGASWMRADAHPDVRCYTEHYGLGATGDGAQSWHHIYFAASSGTYMLRPYDAAQNWGNNSGSAIWYLYQAERSTEPPGGDGWRPPPTSAACYPPSRPTNGLNIAQWIDYLGGRLLYFFAWCPWHTATLSGVRDYFFGVEPFATLLEMQEVVAGVKAEYDQYDWDDEGGGVLGPYANIEQFLPVLPEDSIYRNGRIDIMPDDGVDYYQTECDHEMIPVIGERLGAGLCFGLNVFNNIGGVAAYQMVIDLSSMVALGAYLMSRLRG